MSLVGNFAFNNYDRALETSGPGSPNRPRKYSQDDPSYFSSRTRSDTLVSITDQAATRKRSSETNPLAEGTEKVENDSEDREKQREIEVGLLARQFTRNSTYSQIGNPFENDPDSLIDPYSPNFKPKAWIIAMLKLQSQDSERNLGRSAGIAFRNLSVHGFGTATDYQKSVGNMVLEVVNVVRQIFGFGQHRIDILRNFDGLVQSGEMLVVLGPPGSGCSTLLKTIAGETHGLVVDKESYLNYQGSSNDLIRYSWPVLTP
jgi:ATP-binding cassette, subfamily G (WHITE), member 2, PDR